MRLRLRTSVGALCTVLLSAVSFAQRSLDDWLARSRGDGRSPPNERIESLREQLGASSLDAAARATWLKELRASRLDEPGARGLATALAEADGKHELAAELRLDLAAAALAAGACSEARELLEALDARPIGAWRALVELELAQLARLTQRFAAAQQRIDNALTELAERRDEYSEQMRVHALGERVLLELELGRVDHAARALGQIERAHAASGASALDVPVVLWRASVLVAQDDHRAAIESCERWLAAARSDDPSRALVQYRRDYAALLLASALDDAPQQAVARLESVLEDPRLSAPERWRGWIECARALSRVGADDAARERLARADLALPEAANDCTPRIRRTSLALALAARRPQQRGELERTLDEFRPRWDALLSSWRDVPRPAGGIGWLHSASSLELVCDLANALRALHGPQRGAELAIDELLRAQSVGSLARQLDARAGDLAALRATLLDDERHGLLLLVLAPARSMAFALDRGSLTLHELPGRLRLRELVAPLLAPGSSEAEARAAWSAFFPGELAPWVSQRPRLTIVGAEQLGAIPFELFLAPSGVRLGLSHALDLLPSGPVGLWLHEHRAVPEHRGAALLAVDEPLAALRERFPEVVELNADRESLEDLLAPWGSDAQARIGGGIGLEQYDELVACGPFVVQWITHGVFDAQRDPASGLALELEPGVAWAADFAGRPAPPVVLLSCCAGARAQMRRGDDGVQQLSSAFYLGGARAVVATAGSTRLSHSTAFSRALHRELAAGESVAQAARLARAELAERGDLDPLAWGAWQVTGLGSLRAERVPSRDVLAWMLGAGALAAAALIAWIVVRRRAAR